MGDGSRHWIDNSEELRAWEFDLARQIRTAKAAVERPNSVERMPGQCRLCGQRTHCGQARLSGGVIRRAFAKFTCYQI
jgi:CRISPR-associated exonuclease Cas4